MPKIVFVNRFFYPDLSATAQMLSDLTMELAACGRSVTVVTSRLSYEDSAIRFPAREIIAGVEVIRVPTTRFGRGNLFGRAFDYLSFYVTVSWCLLRTLRRGDVVVAKTDPPLVAVVVALAARLRGARLVNWLQDVFPEVAEVLGVRVLRGFAGRFARILRNRSLRAAYVNVALGDRMAEYLRRQTGPSMPPRQIVVIPNWADDKSIIPLPHKSNPLRSEWCLQDKFVVGYSGNLGRAHEIKTFLEAAKILHDAPAIRFVFIGGGAQMESVRTYVKEQGLPNVDCMPYQTRNQLPYSLGAPNLHLISLRPEVEGFIVPSKFYGIAAAGRPVAFVGDMDGEIARLVARWDCGKSFRPSDSVGLAKYIRQLAASPEYANSIGRNARKALDDNWSQKAALAAWASLLAEAAAVP